MSPSRRRTCSLLEAQRLDGPGALDGLGEGRVDPGVRRALAQVAVLGAGEVPPQPDHQRRDAEQAGQRHPPADRDGGHEGQDGGDQGDRPLGQRVADRPAELVDVARGPGEEVARAGGLDDADGQREGVGHEVLPQLRQHLLAEHLGDVPGIAGQHRGHQQEAGQHDHDAVDVGEGRALLDRLHEVAEQARRSERGQRCSDVECDRRSEQARVSPRDVTRVAAYALRVGDGRAVRLIDPPPSSRARRGWAGRACAGRACAGRARWPSRG